MLDSAVHTVENSILVSSDFFVRICEEYLKTRNVFVFLFLLFFSNVLAGGTTRPQCSRRTLCPSSPTSWSVHIVTVPRSSAYTRYLYHICLAQCLRLFPPQILIVCACVTVHWLRTKTSGAAGPCPAAGKGSGTQ